MLRTAAELSVQIDVGAPVVDAQTHEDGRAGKGHGDFRDFRGAVEGHGADPGLAAGFQPPGRFDGVGVDHAAARHAQIAQQPDFPVRRDIEGGTEGDHALQDMSVRIGLDGVVDADLWQILPELPVIAFDFRQGEHQQRGPVLPRQGQGGGTRQGELRIVFHVKPPFVQKKTAGCTCLGFAAWDCGQGRKKGSVPFTRNFNTSWGNHNTQVREKTTCGTIRITEKGRCLT